MPNKHITIATSAHQPFDDRLFYHMADSLANKGHLVSIISCKSKLSKTIKGIKLDCFDDEKLDKKEKTTQLIQRFLISRPDIIICPEPLAIYAAWKYKKREKTGCKIIYDITEWYPSKKNVENTTGLIRLVQFFKMAIFNFFTCFKINAFIFGEHYKSLPYKAFFPFKNSMCLPYYFNEKYIRYKKKKFGPQSIILGYTGKISREKGSLHLLNTVKMIENRFPSTNFTLKIIGWYANKPEQKLFENEINKLKKSKVHIWQKTDFESFSEAIGEMDILFDLRVPDFENQHCLPIKIFLYAFCGRPVIYSNLKAIRKTIDASEFGYLVNPTNYNMIADKIESYINQPELYNKHAAQGRKLMQEKYNWSMVEPGFLSFIENL
jgi:glycosyltransferase involved in cell wall biosynthesis